jgi:hypothetical protein
MRRSWLFSITVLILAAIGGCAGHKARRPRASPVTQMHGSLAVASGIAAQSVVLPPSFTADLSYPPVWMRQGAEVGVAGTAGGRSVMIGLSGPGFTSQRVLAADFGGPATPGKLLDAATSPDGFALATVLAQPAHDQVVVDLRNLLGPDNTYPLGEIEGDFQAAQLAWIDPFTLMLALQSAAPESAGAQVIESKRSGLFVISAAVPPGIRPLARLACEPRQLSFSPNGRMAVTAGSDTTSAALINLDDATCRTLDLRQPIHVLAWAPDSSAFLFVAIGENGVPGVFRYDVSSGRSVVVAIASGAAAYASDRTIVALGNSRLTWSRAAEFPDRPLNLEAALWQSGTQEIAITPLGVATTAHLLAESRMFFSRATDAGVIDIVVRGGEGFKRELLAYSYPKRAAFPLASVILDAPLAIGWSTDGTTIAVVDRGVQPNLLTVIRPPR